MASKPIFYTVYQTTCLVDGRVFFGAHATTDPTDDYLGPSRPNSPSGQELVKAIREHGPGAFEKHVLFVFDNLEDMLEKEAELTNAPCSGPWNSLNERQTELLQGGKKRVISMYLDGTLVDRIDDYCRKNGWDQASAGRRGGLQKGRTTGRASLVESLFQAILSDRLRVPPWRPSPSPNAFPGEK